jgi:pimeloyl-ACP methyl ester carboxylesterase
MSFIQANGARLFVQDVGRGEPIVFVHEMAADYREWEDQVRWFSRKYRCVTYSARGYKPSDVPANPELYGLEYAADDIAAVIDGLNLERAHVVGLSMGAYAALRFGMKYPQKAKSLVVAGVGSGSPNTDRDAFAAKCRRQAEIFKTQGSVVAAQEIGVAPTRIGLKKKDPLGWQRFVDHLGEHDPLGMAHTLTMYQASRPAIQSFEAELKRLEVPVFLVVGDIDDPCLETNLYLKRTLPDARLLVYPKTGHMINLEEPAAFNEIVQQFLDRGMQ